MLESKLEFLKDYTLSENKNIRIVSYNEVRDIGSDKIPRSWFKIFENNDNDKRIELLLNEWKNSHLLR